MHGYTIYTCTCMYINCYISTHAVKYAKRSQGAFKNVKPHTPEVLQHTYSTYGTLKESVSQDFNFVFFFKQLLLVPIRGIILGLRQFVFFAHFHGVFLKKSKTLVHRLHRRVNCLASEGLPQLLKQQTLEKQTPGILYYQLAWDLFLKRFPDFTLTDLYSAAPIWITP